MRGRGAGGGGGAPAPAAQCGVGGFTVRFPSLDIHTIGAGGGSIAAIDPGGALTVGPRSAGADPGPACYGRGGSEPTVTDANLVLGLLAAEAPLAGGVELDPEAARGAVAELAGDAGRRRAMSASARRMARPDAARIIVDRLLELAR